MARKRTRKSVILSRPSRKKGMGTQKGGLYSAFLNTIKGFLAAVLLMTMIYGALWLIGSVERQPQEHLKTNQPILVSDSHFIPADTQAYRLQKKPGQIPGNMRFNSFSAAKKKLKQEVYTDQALRRTIYCDAVFDEEGVITLPAGFETNAYASRVGKIEWEHVVPAEAFGRYFEGWRKGHPSCISPKGVLYSGRKCAEKTNVLYQRMQADLYNLYPAIGAVNAARQNYPFEPLSDKVPASFGSCAVKIRSRVVDVPLSARGVVARTYLYMEAAYPVPILSPAKKKLMEAWSLKSPVTKTECVRAYRIEGIQGNINPYVKKPCLDKGFWPKPLPS